MSHRLPRATCLAFVATLAGCALFNAPLSSPARGPMTPRNGLEVIGAMRHAHPSRSLRSLSFTVTTTDHRAEPVRVAASRTYARLPGKFRVARLPVNSQSGFVRDRHVMAVFEDGERVTTLRRVDLATLLAYDVFAQS